MLFKRLLKQIRGKQSGQDEGLLHKSKDRKSNWLWHRSRLYLFSMFIVLVSITCSLMGPATAVLVLPNLQWTEINKNTGSPPKWLDSLQAGQPPYDIPVPGCEPRNFTSGNFSCLSGYYGYLINSLVASAIATDVQAWPDQSSTSPDDSLIVLPVFQEGNVTFSANVSGGILVSWIPLRQSVHGFNEDVANFDLAVSSTTPPQPGYPDSDLFSKSLQARLQRHGPTVGMKGICILNGPNEQTVSNFTIHSDQAVRCYEANGEAWCIPSGAGWSGINVSSSSFTIEDSNTTDPESVGVSVYSASISLTMANGTFQSIKNGSEPGWNWSTAFSNQSLVSNVSITDPIQAVEYYSPNFDPDSSIWCTSNYALGTANYVLDPSEVTNQLRLIVLNVDHENGSLDAGTPLYVDADWILAGWAVDRNGSVKGSMYISVQLINALQNFINKGKQARASLDFVNFHRFITIQSLSMIPFTNTSTKPSNRTTAADKSLSRSAQIQAWSFSLGSRTSTLGVTIVMIGCLLTIMRTIMYYHCRADTMDTTAILESILNRYPLVQNERETEMEEEYPTLVMDDIAGVIGFRA